MLFDEKNFNGEVFAAYVDQVEDLNRNELLKSGAIVEKPEYASMLPDQVGGHYINLPIKARIGGKSVNYDGNTNIEATSRKTYTQGRIVVGRANGWTEKDFSSDVTGEDFLPAAEEIAKYWDNVDQATLLNILKGIFAMTGAKNLEFAKGHTYDISDTPDNMFGETTLNTGIQKALGDNKAKFKVCILHSQVATNIENKKLIAYLKHTDKEGIERDLTLYSINGRLALVDDNMPSEEVEAEYVKATAADAGALKVVSGEPGSASEIKLDDVTPAVEGYEPAVGDYVVLLPAGTKYTTYILGEGAIEYTNCGAKVPYEMDRRAEKNGGETTLYSRQRKIFSPVGISFKTGSIISPTDEQLADGSNWELANSNEEGSKKEYYPHKSIPIARIISRG